MSENNMATRERINITLHPIELKKLDRIAKIYKETRSGMLTRLIQEYEESNKHGKDIGDLTELSHDLR